MSERWSDRPEYYWEDPQLEEALTGVEIDKGGYAWVVRPYNRKIEVYVDKETGYDDAMLAAAKHADWRGGPSKVEVYQYFGEGAWVFARESTVTVEEKPKWGNPSPPSKASKNKLLK